MKSGAGVGRGLRRATEGPPTHWDVAGEGVVGKPAVGRHSAPTPMPAVFPGAPGCSVLVGKRWHLPRTLVQPGEDPPLQREVNPALWALGRNQPLADFGKTFAQIIDALE